MARRKRQLTQARPCKHCGREFLTNALINHERVCPMGPDAHLHRQFLLDTAEFGYMISQAEYNRTKPPGLTSGEVLARAYGSWDELAASLGLRFILHARQREIAVEDAKLDIVSQSIEIVQVEELPPMGVQALHGWKQRTYIDRGRVREELYATLR